MNATNKDDSKKRLVKMLIIVIPIIILLIVVFFVLNKSQYEKIEDQMVKNAKKYIKEKNINVTNQEIVFIDDLDIESGVELCSKASGVVVTNIAGSIKYYPYLKCINYESKILENTNSYIELNGPDVIQLNLGTLYFDQGYTKKRDDIEVETVGIVPNEVGAYTINYVVTKNGKQKTIVKRIVIVSEFDPEIITTNLNKEEPNIILKGEKEMVLAINSKYEEPGYAAYDYKDGLITDNVSVNPDVISTDKVGKNVIVYSVKNSNGKNVSVQRIVNVVKNLGNVDINILTLENGSLINESVVEITIYGDGFKSLLLPDGQRTEERTLKYNIKSNGVYVFKVEDIYGNIINKTIEVNNIDNQKPTGSCNVKKQKNETIVSVDASDDKGIKSVDYILNGNETGFLVSTTYHTKEKVDVAVAIIKDVAGNTTQVSCTIANDNSSSDTYSFNYDNNKKLIGCDSYKENDRKVLESKLAKAINKAGYSTRAGVVEAVRFLVGGLDYKIPYLGIKNNTIDPEQVLGVYNKVGLNIANDAGWGCTINGFTQGMDPKSLLKWAFINAGLYFDENFAVLKSSEVANELKLGDLLLTACDNCGENTKYSDIGIIIGIDGNKIYVAEASSNAKTIVMTELDKNKMPTSSKFALASLYNYDSDGNLTNMWN